MNEMDIRGIKYTPLLKRFYSPDTVQAKYITNKVAIGKEIYTGKPIYLDFRQSNIIGILGKRGSGKSFIMEGIVSRAYNSDILPCIITDIKPEFYALSEPADDKFISMLNENEIPKGVPIVNYFPKFLEKFNSKIEFDYCPVAMTFDDLTLSDFLTFVKADFSRAQMAALESVFRAKENKEVLNFKEMISYFRQQPEIDDRTISSIKIILENLVSYEVVGDQYGMDLLTTINQNKIPNMVLQGWFNLGKFVHYVAAFVALMVRYLIDIKVNRLSKNDRKFLMIIDEAPRLMPSEGNMSSKKALLDCIDISRSYGISMIFGGQSISRLPPQAIEQMKYILLPYNIDIETAKEVFKRKGLLDVSPNMFEYEVRSIFNSLRKYRSGQREWLLIDTDAKEWETIVPFAPLGHHIEEI